MLKNKFRFGAGFFAIVFISSFGASSLFPLVSSAISKEQKKIYNKNINYFEYDVCGGNAESTDDLSAGTGAPGGTSFPNLPPEAMAKGINDYIEETNSSSKMKGLGETIVKGGKKSNINPFLIVAIAQKESGLSNPTDYNVSHGNNSFGRTATSSQPHFEGARTWYKWSTVKASVDPDADENKNTNVGDIAAYIRNSDFYDQGLKTNDITKIMMVYAPPGDNNDTAQYIQDIKTWTRKMIRLTKNHGGYAGSTSTSTGASSITINSAFKAKPVPGTHVTIGYASKGTASTYGNDPKTNYVDTGDNNQPAQPGATNDDPGIAVYNSGSLGGWWKVISPDNKGAILRQTDIGPSTDKVVDINAVAARSVFGHKAANFPTGEGTWKIEYMGKTKPPGAIEHDGESASDAGSSPKNDSCCLAENTTTNLPGRNKEEKIWNYLVGELKLSDKQAAGVMGNMQQESGFDPTIVNSDSGAYGIAQWYAGRKTALENFAQEKGKSMSNLGVQLEYLKKELEGSYKTSVYEPLKNASTVAEATRIWLEKFEVPCMPGPACDGEMNTRLPMSQGFFDKYSSGSTDTSSASSDDSPACPGSDTNGGGVDGVSWPVKKSFWDQHPDWFTKPHHDHPSADIPVPSGTKLYSMIEGKVTIAGETGACGIMVEVQSKEDSGVKIGYCHGTPGSLKVKVGDNVTSGQQLMLSDNTGTSSGPHLHVQIHVNGQIRCPQKAFKDLGANKTVSFNSLPSSGCTN